MGEQDVRELDTELQRDFTRKLLADLRALELLLDHGFLESGVRRIGVEQELFLVDRRWRPAPLAMEMIDRLADDHFTTEVVRFNLEFNSDTLVFETDCLSRLERQLEALLARAREAAAELGIGLVMVGILPENMARSWSQIEPYGFIILLALIFTRTVDFVLMPIIYRIAHTLLSI